MPTGRAGFPLTAEAAVVEAAALVRKRFPQARSAWLAGSVVRGTATATSDLDITVLLDGHPAPYRESLRHHGIPVELFVQTPASLAYFRGKDQERRQPTLARLVAESVTLVDRDGRAADAAASCAAELAAGPAPLTEPERDAARYAVTDLLDDLTDATEPAVAAAVGALVWEQASRLLLGVERRWQGTGKGLLRELRHRDDAVRAGSTGVDPSTDLGARLCDALVRCGIDRQPLVDAVTDVLDHCGGGLFEGFRLGSPPGLG